MINSIELSNSLQEEATSESASRHAIESYVLFADSTRQFREKYATLRNEGWIELKTKCKVCLPEALISQSTLSKINLPEVNLSRKLTQPSGPFKIMHFNLKQNSPSS